MEGDGVGVEGKEGGGGSGLLFVAIETSLWPVGGGGEGVGVIKKGLLVKGEGFIYLCNVQKHYFICCYFFNS